MRGVVAGDVARPVTARCRTLQLLTMDPGLEAAQLRGPTSIREAWVISIVIIVNSAIIIIIIIIVVVIIVIMDSLGFCRGLVGGTN